MVRKSIVAGLFYEGNVEKLKDQIKSCFTTGPGLPEVKKDGFIKGAIVPHAGYPYSGRCAAYAYKEIFEHDLPDTFIILGTNHSGPEVSITLEDYETPLGIARNDVPLTRAIINNGVRNDLEPHENEHSIEVQIPFLQYFIKDLKIVPIVVGGPRYKLAAEAIRKAVKETGRKVCIIASSDFTHYGFTYGYVPFTENIRDNIEKLDKGAISFIEKNDSTGFLNYTERTGVTICGKYAIAALIDALFKSDVELLKYTMSGDIIRDYSISVSYASILFR